MGEFVRELEAFIESAGGLPEGVSVCPVPLSHFAPGGGFASVDEAAVELLRIREGNIAAGVKETVFIYEDLWRSRQELVRRRLRSHLGVGEKVFARNCDVREISQLTAAAFLERHHVYGATKACYRYGLFRRRATGTKEAGMPDTATMVAVGTFSKKFEWERYASLPQVRVCGGMGKVLNHFLNAAHPPEVLSYADLEWSDGSVYAGLGFVRKKRMPPEHFLIDQRTWERVHLRKMGRDRKYRDCQMSKWVEVANPGSLCMLLNVAGSVEEKETFPADER